MGASEWFICTAWQPDPRLALRAAQEQLLLELRRQRPGTKVTIESVREEAGDAGTGTILDIVDVADEPEVALATAADAKLLRRALGTTKPSRELVEDRWQDLVGFVNRWDAVFFAVYANGVPTAWCFVGCTGDGGSVQEPAFSPSGVYRPTPELAAVIGEQSCDRPEAIKRFWAYLRKKGLHDGKGGELRPDDAVAKVLGSKRSVSRFELLGLGEVIMSHLIPVEGRTPEPNPDPDPPPARKLRLLN